LAARPDGFAKDDADLSTDLMMTTTQEGEHDLGAIVRLFGSLAAGYFGIVMRIVEAVAIGMLIAAVFGTGWLAAGQTFSVVVN